MNPIKCRQVYLVEGNTFLTAKTVPLFFPGSDKSHKGDNLE
jgi:hypothetical protein